MTPTGKHPLMKDLSKPKTPAEYARLYFTGFAMGAADIVPGVSGGTMAFIMGVYETLIDAIKSFDLEAIRLALGFKFKEVFEHVSLRFLVVLGLGILTAIITLSTLLHNLLESQPTYVFAFFGGLILASVVAVGIRVTWNMVAVVALLIGTAAGFIIVGLPAFSNVSHDPIILFLSGMVAICAMILPGISGSFILLVLGQYEFVLGAVKSRDILSLIAVALGCVVGIVIFSRILSWLLKNYENSTIALLVGFMVGSLRLIIHRAVILENAETGQEYMANLGATEIGISIVLIIIGFLLVSFIDHLQTRTNPVISLVWKKQQPVSA